MLGQNMPTKFNKLGVTDMKIWNKIAILKHLWAISKKYNMWIKLVHYYYVKHRNLEVIPIPENATCVVRKIIDSRKVLQSQYLL